MKRVLMLFGAMQVVWFYLAAVPGGMDLSRYEIGQGPMPFQGRALMMLPLRIASHSVSLQHFAFWLSSLPGWFPHGCHVEGVVEAVVDTFCLLVAAWVTTRLYEAISPTKILRDFVGPLSLVMAMSAYAINTIHALRFVYDFPSLALFALGMESIFFRRGTVWFTVIFMIATINRETSIFLLVMQGLQLTSESENEAAHREGAVPRWVVVFVLFAFWIGWHFGVGQIFRRNPSVAAPRFLLNIGTILCPFSWLQLISFGAFSLPMLFCKRRDLRNSTIHAWMLVFPLWLVVMLFFGLVVETRIFGELVPYVACCVALLAEQAILKALSITL